MSREWDDRAEYRGAGRGAIDALAIAAYVWVLGQPVRHPPDISAYIHGS